MISAVILYTVCGQEVLKKKIIHSKFLMTFNMLGTHQIQQPKMVTTKKHSKRW